MNKKKATIIDLEIGNIFSLRSALNYCGIDTKISSIFMVMVGIK